MLYLIIYFINTLLANDLQTHLLDHKNPGCPTNSECSKEMGVFYKQWIKVLSSKNIKKIQSFYNKNGLPLELWVLKKHDSKKRILWDSRCKNHNKNETYIKSALVQGSSFKDYKNDPRYIARTALVLSQNNITTYTISNTDLPLYNSKKGLVFLKSVNGKYFSHSLSSHGKYLFLKAKNPPIYPQTVSCPNKLKKEYKKLKHPKNLYSGHFCQKIWNEDSDITDVIMTGWDCN